MFNARHSALLSREGSSLHAEQRNGRHDYTTYVVAASLLIALLYVATDGSLFAAVAVIGLVLMVGISFYRLDWGFYLFIAMVMGFDQFPPRGYETSIIGVEYFQNLKSFSFFANVDAAAVNPLELHLLLLIFIWLLLIVLGKPVHLQRVPVWFAAILFFLWIGVATVYGMGRGGEFLPALWELRALFYFGLMFFFVPQIIQSRAQLTTLIWVCIGAISFKALQGLIRIARLGFQFGERTELTNHEDPLFFIALFVLLFGFMLYHARTKQRTVIAWLLVPLLFVFILAQRRATYVALGVAILGLMFLISNRQRGAMLKVIAPALVIFGLYLAAFWTNEGAMGLPAQLVKSVFATDKESAGERYYSNLYREFENYNLGETLKKSPAIGIGFGNKYDQPITLAFIPFSLRDYIPHNEIFWLAVKMGAVGFFCFWLFLDAYVFQAAHIFSKLNDPYLKTICAVTIIAIMGQIVVSYVDLQLTFYRNMIFLGLLMGLLPTLELLDAQHAAPGEENLHEPARQSGGIPHQQVFS
jgi:hypothetical protein